VANLLARLNALEKLAKAKFTKRDDSLHAVPSGWLKRKTGRYRGPGDEDIDLGALRTFRQLELMDKATCPQKPNRKS
jgi:hypothetical protein